MFKPNNHFLAVYVFEDILPFARRTGDLFFGIYSGEAGKPNWRMTAQGCVVRRPQMKNKFHVRFACRGALLFGYFFLDTQEKVTRAGWREKYLLNK